MHWKDKLGIMNVIRVKFRHSLPVRDVMKRAISTTEFGGRGGKRYVCNMCKRAFEPKDVQVDHIDPVVPYGKIKKEMALQEFIDRTYCSERNLQVLCKKCHHSKTHSKQPF